MTPKEILALIREKEVRAVDLRFMDFPGLWQHFTIPAETLEEHVFEGGVTEAACKTVYTQRLRLRGMAWKHTRAQTILSHRILQLSGVWEAA